MTVESYNSLFDEIDENIHYLRDKYKVGFNKLREFKRNGKEVASRTHVIDCVICGTTFIKRARAITCTYACGKKHNHRIARYKRGLPPIPFQKKKSTEWSKEWNMVG